MFMLITMKSLQVLMFIALGIISQPVFFADTAEATPCNCEPKWDGDGSGQYYICCTNSAVTGQPSRCARYTRDQHYNCKH